MSNAHKLELKAIYLGVREEKQHGREEPWRYFAWDITLRNGRETLHTPYKAGMGHVLGYRNRFGKVWSERDLREVLKLAPGTRAWQEATADPVPKEPSLSDVLYSLAMDANAWGNSRGFEDFCGEFGYDADSRTAERVYNACAETYKQLRALLGEDFQEVLAMDEGALQSWCAQSAEVQS